jgi:hypothetical protein
MDIVYLKGRSTAFAVLLWMFVFALLDSAVLLLVKRPLHQLDKEKRRIIIGLAGCHPCDQSSVVRKVYP